MVLLSLTRDFVSAFASRLRPLLPDLPATEPTPCCFFFEFIGVKAMLGLMGALGVPSIVFAKLF